MRRKLILFTYHISHITTRRQSVKENVTKDKSLAFAKRVVKLQKFLTEEKKEFILSKQILRSGTSIGANVREAYQGESKADFVHKLSIAQKEADETCYWLELLKTGDYLNERWFNSIYPDCQEVLKIITSVIISTKKKM